MRLSFSGKGVYEYYYGQCKKNSFSAFLCCHTLTCLGMRLIRSSVSPVAGTKHLEFESNVGVCTVQA